ncbi:receptor-type tyrosine-protein phosphatase H [Sarcophilus harrisii]
MSGLSPGPGHLLDVLLVLVCWAGSLASAQVDIPALHVEKQTNVSVTLTWEPPNESSPRYIVTWAKEGQLLGTNGTTATQYTVENLQPGTLYEFTVEVEGNSSGKSLNAATVPNEVEALRMKARSNSSVTLQWGVPKGPQYSDYTYWISWSKKNGLVGEANTTKTEHVVEGLDAATEYTFRVKAERNNISISGLSRPVATVPNEVEALRMKTQSNSSVTLQWEVPKGPQYSDYTYWISWSKETVLVGEASTTKTEHVVEGLEAATEYNFTVKAERNNVNSSGLSRPVATVPNEVEDLSMKARSNSSVTLQWAVPKGPQYSDYTYWISWSKKNVLVGEANTTKTEHVVEGLDAATEYTFRVKAERNNVSSSGLSCPVATVPNEVKDLSMKAPSNSSVTLQWGVPKGPQYSDYTYWISWSKENVLVGEASTTKTEHVVEGLEAATEYNFTVKAERNNVSSSGLSRPVATVPNEVEDLSMKARSNSSVTLQWGVPKGPQYSDYTYWISWSKENVLVGEASTMKTEHVVEGLDAATEYNFTVKAERNNVSSSGLSLLVATVPNEVEDLSMKARSNSSVTLQWGVPKGPHSDYTYWISWSKENVLVGEASTMKTEHVVEGLEAATEYTFIVKAERNNVSSSSQSLLVATVPNEVEALRMKPQSNSSVTLQWEVPKGPQYSDYTYWISWSKENVLVGETNTTKTEHVVEGLDAATEYNFTVKPERNNVNSSGLSFLVATVPNEVEALRMKARSNSSVTLQWEVPKGPQYSDYTYWISWSKENVLVGETNTTKTEHVVEGLDAATEYNFTVKPERNNVNSSGLSFLVATVPNEVEALRMKPQSNSSVTLQWEVPKGPQYSDYTYWISWSKENVLVGETNTTKTEHVVEGLDAATEYNFTVKPERNNVNSSGLSFLVATVPNEVEALRMKARSNSSVTLQWEVPKGPQYSDYTYWISWSKETVLVGEASTTKTEHVVEGLEAATEYNFTVKVERNNVNSSGLSLPVATVPNEVTDLQVLSQTNTSIALAWAGHKGAADLSYRVSWVSSGTEELRHSQEPRFTAEGLSPGSSYQFLVSSVTADGAQGPERAINGSTAPDPVTITSCTSAAAGYGVVLALACPAGGQESLELEVGDQRAVHRGPCASSVSLRGLQPARSYTAIVRSLWAGMSAISAPVTCYTESGGVIAGAIIGVLLFVLLVGLLIFFLKRRRGKAVPEKPQSRGVSFSSPGDISAEDLAAHILKNQKDSDCGFAEEYQQLALEGTGQMQTAAAALENRSKNRFSNVLPYDWSRVPLQPLPGDPSSDYINASFIPGLLGPREYIATQGPLPQTVGDFWRLVWNQQSRTIVMLTNCVESGRVKCEHYWPLDAQTCNHGRLQVTLKGEDVAEHWTIRDLQLFHMDLKESLSVRQFHFTAWPDHGVPRSPDPLLAFQALLRQWLEQSPEGGPPIVHCSAGVGRTGTLIALDVLLRQLQKYRHVGVQSFIRKMRRSRPLMVQTEGQYIFLYQTLLRFQQRSQAAEDTSRAQEEILYENVGAIQAYEQEMRVI